MKQNRHDFQRGGVETKKKKPLSGRGMDIFWHNTFEFLLKDSKAQISKVGYLVCSFSSFFVFICVLVHFPLSLALLVKLFSSVFFFACLFVCFFFL